MMYPFLQLEDGTEIVHSEMQSDGQVKVYIEKPVDGGFHSAMCYLPGYNWKDVDGFSETEINSYQQLIATVAHLIIRFSQNGGFEYAANL